MPTFTPKVEIQLLGDTTWTDITSYVYERDGIKISRGVPSENQLSQPQTLNLTLNNRSGRFSPRNPTGPYYGLIGRSTPIRVSLPPASGNMRLINRGSTTISCPDSAATSITGDLDLRFDANMPSWSDSESGTASGSGMDFAYIAKRGASSQISYEFKANVNGGLRLVWSADGTTSLFADSTVPLPIQSGRQAVRVTIDVNNGAGGNTVTFYTSDTLAGTWTQLGAAVVQSGTTSIFDSTSVTYTQAPYAEIYGLKVLQNIGGTERANPDFTAQSAGATSFADAAGNTWSVPAPAEITNRKFRFYGEVSAWPVKWDATGRDVYVELEAAGVMRRMLQGATPLRSTMYQALLAEGGLYGYWPCEDSSDAASFASAIGGPPMTWVGAPTLASSDDFDAALNLPLVSNSQWHGRVSPTMPTGTIYVRWLMMIGASGVTDQSRLIRIYTTGGAQVWDVLYNTGGAMSVDAYDSGGTTKIVASGAIGFTDLRGRAVRCSLELTQNGSDVDWSLRVMSAGATSGQRGFGTASGTTCGRVTDVWVDYNGNVDDCVMGHVSVQGSSAGSIYDRGQELAAFDGETAGNRVQRLLTNEGTLCSVAGNIWGAELMGPQEVATPLDLVREAEVTDAGLLFEARHFSGFTYRTRDSLYSRSSSFTLDYAGDDLSGIEPVEDDSIIRNDVTVNRRNGSSARATLTSGQLGTASPPTGAGKYDTTIEINPQTDAVLQDHASWRLNLGTVDEPRYPTLAVQLARANFTAAERDQVLDLDVADLIQVSNPPSWLPPGTIRQGIIGYTETLDGYLHAIDFRCVPASPYEVGFYDDSGDRFDTAGSTLNGAHNSTTTSLSVATAAGAQLWTTAAGNLPFDLLISGEQVRVTAVSGASSPQTLTVTRSVNGVVKSLASGSTVELYSPSRFAL